MPERARFLRGMTSWIGFRQIGVPYTRDARFAGTSKYPLGEARPPRVRRHHVVLDRADQARDARSASRSSSSASGVLGWTVYVALLHARTHPQGWTSVIAVVLLLGGVQLLSLGVIGPVRRADLRRDEAAAALPRRRGRRARRVGAETETAYDGADDARELARSSCSSSASRCASSTFWSESREITVE